MDSHCQVRQVMASDPDPRHENEFLEGAVDKTDTQTYNVYFSQSP
jgi:hypothetical protein